MATANDSRPGPKRPPVPDEQSRAASSAPPSSGTTSSSTAPPQPWCSDRSSSPNGSDLAGTLAAFATFAVGFIARPFGGVDHGPLRRPASGRKSMLVALAAADGRGHRRHRPAPTYDAIGVWAPILLVALRFIQGIGVGGEWGGAVLMATEHAPEGQVGLYGAAPQMGVPAGVILANVVFLAVHPADDRRAFLTLGLARAVPAERHPGRRRDVDPARRPGVPRVRGGRAGGPITKIPMRRGASRRAGARFSSPAAPSSRPTGSPTCSWSTY